MSAILADPIATDRYVRREIYQLSQRCTVGRAEFFVPQRTGQ